MAMNQDVFTMLTSILGVPERVAKVAASKFGNVDTAANWAYDNMHIGEGEGEGAGVDTDWGIGNEGPDNSAFAESMDIDPLPPSQAHHQTQTQTQTHPQLPIRIPAQPPTTREPSPVVSDDGNGNGNGKGGDSFGFTGLGAGGVANAAAWAAGQASNNNPTPSLQPNSQVYNGDMTEDQALEAALAASAQEANNYSAPPSYAPATQSQSQAPTQGKPTQPISAFGSSSAFGSVFGGGNGSGSWLGTGGNTFGQGSTLGGTVSPYFATPSGSSTPQRQLITGSANAGASGIGAEEKDKDKEDKSRRARSPTPGPPDLDEKKINEARADQLKGVEGEVGVGEGKKQTNPFLGADGSVLGLGGVSGSGTGNDTDLAEKTDQAVGALMSLRGDQNQGHGNSNNPFQAAMNKGVRFAAGGGGAGGEGNFKKVADDTEDTRGERALVPVGGMVEHVEDAMMSSGNTIAPATPPQSTFKRPQTPVANATPVPMYEAPTDKETEEEQLARAIHMSLDSSGAFQGPLGPNDHTGGEQKKVTDMLMSEGGDKMDVDMPIGPQLPQQQQNGMMDDDDDWKDDEDEGAQIADRDPKCPMVLRSQFPNVTWAAHFLTALLLPDQAKKYFASVGIRGDFDKIEVSRNMQILKLVANRMQESPKTWTNITYKLYKLRADQSAHLRLGRSSFDLANSIGDCIFQNESLNKLLGDSDKIDQNKPVEGNDGQTDVGDGSSAHNSASAVQQPDAASGQPSGQDQVTQPEPSPYHLNLAHPVDQLQHPQSSQSVGVTYSPPLSTSVSSGIHLALDQYFGGQRLTSAGSLLGVAVVREEGVQHELLQLEEEIYLDRYMLSNVEATTHIVAKQAELRQQLEVKQNELSNHGKHKDQDVLRMIERTIKHLNGEYGPKAGIQPTDEEGSTAMATVDAAVSQLEAIKERLQQRKEALLQDIQKLQSDIVGVWDEPSLKTMPYTLRAACLHSGFDTHNAMRTYLFVPEEQQWWIYSGDTIEKTNFKTLKEDNWGLMWNAGPFFLVYERKQQHA